MSRWRRSIGRGPTDRATRSPRTWAYRLVQLSPIPVIVITLVIWFSLPTTLATIALNNAPGLAGSTPESRSAYFDSADRQQIVSRLNIDEPPETSLQTAIQESWAAWVDSLPADPRPSDVLEPVVFTGEASQFSGQAPFSRVDEWERVNGTKVWAWVVPGAPMPSVAASAVADTYALDAFRDELRGQQANAANSSEPAPQSLEELLWRYDGNRPSSMPPIDPNTLTLGSSGGMGSDGYFLTGRLLRASNQTYWRAVVIGTPKNAEDPMPEEIPGLEGVDPALPGLSARVQRIADTNDVDIWIFGPINWTAVPLRVPSGKTAEDADRLAQIVWPAMLIEANTTGDPLPQPLLSSSDTAGGKYGLTRATGLNNTPYYGGEMYRPDQIAPQTVVWLAVWDRLPSAPRLTPMQASWQRWQRFDAAWFPTLLGVCIGLLGLTLVASPIAFVAERKRATRERVRLEMARMRRDAHDKVYNRLSALSKRVAVAGDELAAINAEALLAVAEDIRHTVSELQGILGDETLHVNAALTTMPLLDQLEAVALAQARRLAVEVDVEATGQIPEVDAQTGWDLQCIAEEAVSNAVRHGGAKRVRIRVGTDADILTITLADNGSGCSLLDAEDAPGGSTGLRGMRDRLAKRGGTLTIESCDSGTTLLVRLPL